LKDFIKLFEHNPEALKFLVVGICTLIGLVLTIVFAKLGWLKYFKLGKDGVELKNNSKKVKQEAYRKFESGNINKLCDDQILNFDNELVDYALELANKLRRTLNISLNKQVGCSGTRRSLASCLRYPLWEASRKNNFKYLLRPENIKHYIDKLIRDVTEEYNAFAIEKSARCANDNNLKCPDLPPLDDTIKMMRSELITQWAIPIREKTIEICEKKSNLYRQFIPLYKDLGDDVHVLVCEHCIEKNEVHIKALKRTPEVNEL